ncbi:MAG: nucleotide sugar dehydrogenase [Candidatus Levybacteria bacterium]|nr:nucleotide sugar dehydrogenase [Candidatus Levybacteria bacterium]
MLSNKNLLEKIKNKTANIGVIGLGYVGLPLAVLLAKNNFKVTGFVRSESKRDSLNKGVSYLLDAVLEGDLKTVIKSNNFICRLTSDKELENMDAYIICVPTPVNEHKIPDISDLKQVAKRLSQISLEGKLVVNESTVAPFTTRDVLGKIGENYFLVCSPERIDPGNNSKTTENIAKVIGGIDGQSLEAGVALYKQILKEELAQVKTLEAAEMAKMLENTYRAVNIALINEFARLAEKINIDILDVIKAAKTKWSFHPHFPGIGVGGHCIPVDPYYILELAKDKGVAMKVVKEGLEENEQMPLFVAQKVDHSYKKGMKVLVYGLTYKKNVADMRESPVTAFCNILRERNISFSVYDPLLKDKEIEKLGFNAGSLEKADIFIVGTDHKQLSEDFKKAVGDNTVVIDGRNFFTEKVGKAVYGVGRSLL